MPLACRDRDRELVECVTVNGASTAEQLWTVHSTFRTQFPPIRKRPSEGPGVPAGRSNSTNLLLFALELSSWTVCGVGEKFSANTELGTSRRIIDALFAAVSGYRACAEPGAAVKVSAAKIETRIRGSFWEASP